MSVYAFARALVGAGAGPSSQWRPAYSSLPMPDTWVVEVTLLPLLLLQCRLLNSAYALLHVDLQALVLDRLADGELLSTRCPCLIRELLK
jgi:hypothetical protein